ncbi:MAG: winged helix-turn-helix transcriptional regulator [Actinophytocola sp.]
MVGERWSLLVLREAFLGFRRFDDFAHNTGASRDILAATEDAGGGGRAAAQAVHRLATAA